MARFDHLPIYNKSYELTKACFRTLEQMPRGHKKSLGERLVNSALRQTQIITYANGVQNKELALAKLLLEIDNMVLLLRVATDLKALSLSAGHVLVERVSEVRKQAEGWKDWAKKQRNDSRGESRGGIKAGSQMSQGSRILGASAKAGPWEPKPDSRKRGV